MINCNEAVTAVPKSERDQSSVNKISVKEEPTLGCVSSSNSFPDETNIKISTGNSASGSSSYSGMGRDNQRRGVKRSIETEEDDEEEEDDDDDDLIENNLRDTEEDLEDEEDVYSVTSDHFRDEDIDDDESGEDKSWHQFASLRRGRGRPRNYGLRPRSGIRRSWAEGDPSPSRGGPSRRGRGSRGAQKSKYRRNTANARERDRMKEINIAFANLRGALPSFTCRRITSMTKIKTLKLAASYIRALGDLLSDAPSEESKNLALELFQDLPEENSLITSLKKSMGSSVDIVASEPNFSLQSASSINLRAHNSDMSHNNNYIKTQHFNPNMKAGATSILMSDQSVSALEAALSRPSKISSVNEQNLSMRHHLGTRPHLVLPPPLRVENNRSHSSAQSSSIAKSPHLPTTNILRGPSGSRESSPSNVFSPMTVTANVNVIPLQSDKSDSEMAYPTSQSKSLIFKNTHDTHNLSPLPNCSQMVPASVDTHFSFSGMLSPASVSGDLQSKYEQPISKFTNHSSQYPSNSYVAINSSNQNASTAMSLQNVWSQTTVPQSNPSPNQQLTSNLSAPNIFSPTNVSQERLTTQSTSPVSSQSFPVQSSCQSLYVSTHSSKNVATSFVESFQPSTTSVDYVNTSVLSSESSPMLNTSEITHESVSGQVYSCLPDTSQQLGSETSEHSANISWSNMNVELNTLFKESDCTSSENSAVNWDELCWAIE